MKEYFVYILSSLSNVLYIGVTNNLEFRVYEHKNKLNSGFTSKYKVNRLVYYENYENITEAIDREKQLKAWKRQWKLELIDSQNPKWEDLSQNWFEEIKTDPESSSG